MKKRHFLLAGLAALFMASCSDNELNQENQIIERDTDLYLRVSISNPLGTGSRANDEEIVGTEAENDIHNILFVFYDKEENYVGKTSMKKASGETPEKDEFFGITSTPEGTSNIDAVLDLVVPVNLTAGVGAPYYVMAYVNPTISSANDQTSSLAKVRTLLRKIDDITPSSSTSGHQGFTMTNSVYYGDGETPIIASIIPEGGLFKTREEAAKTDLEADKRLKIYVERIVAKVSVGYAAGVTADDMNQDNNTPRNAGITEETTVTLNFKPRAWGLNNLERSTFLIKNFRIEASNVSENEGVFSIFTVTNDKKSTIAAGLNISDWNDVTNFRSYWAYSSTYFAGGKYPSTASQYRENGGQYSLDYRSFNDFYNVEESAKGAYGAEINGDKCLYTLENTCVSEVIVNQAQRALTSVVVVGQYYVNDAQDAATFYLRRTKDKNYYYSEDDMSAAFMKANSVIGTVTKEGDQVKFTATKTFSSDFVIDHPSKDITGTYEAPSRYVTLMLKKEALKNTGGTTYFYMNEHGQPTEITEENLAVANAALYNTLAANNLGGIIQFTNGMAYFNVPIKHNASEDVDFASAKTGDYGVVRNHAYVLNLESISGIGIGVRDPDDPIIVPVETQEYHVRTELNVLKWKVKNNGNVTLKN